MQIPDDLRYTENHEWARREDDGTIRVGITDYAQDALGDIVYVELPDVGREVAASEAISEVESTKSVAEVYAPLAGTVLAVNEALVDAPEIVNSDPYGEGWFFTLTPAADATLDGLMDPAGYATFSE